MNYYNESEEMSNLLAQHSVAKKTMTKGIVLTAIGYFLLCFGLGFLAAYFLGIIFIIPSIPMLIIGIKSLVSGIKERVKANKAIKLLKEQEVNPEMNNGVYNPRMNNEFVYQPNAPMYQNNGAYQPAPQQPDPNFGGYQPAPQQPAPQQPDPNFGGYQPAPQQPAPQQPDPNFGSYQQPAPQQPAPQQPDPNFGGYQPAAGRYFVDIDLNKYAPLECGVTFNPNKDYKFHRAEGFVGSVPQSFVNRTFPRCPLCCNNNPYWLISGEAQMSWKGNLYYFKCSCCNGVISMSVPDVTTLGNGGSGVALNPSVGLANLIAKKSSGKEAGAVYAVIESVGTSGVSRYCEGKEFKLEHMQDMFLRM